MRLLRDVIFMAGARVSTLSCVALLNVLTSRVLGPQGRGLYALPTIDCGLAATLVVGVSSALSYFMLSRGDERGVVRAGVAAAFLLLLVGAALTTFIALSNHQLWALAPALAYLPCYAALTIVSGYCIGRDRMRYWGVINVAVPIVTLVTVGGAFLIFGKTPTVAVGGWLAGTAIVALAAVALAAPHMRSVGGDSVDVVAFVRFAAKAGGLNMVTLLNYRIDLYIVAMLAPLSTLGLYAVAVAGAEAAVALAHAFSLATQPRVGTLARREAAEFTARCVRNNLLFATLLCSGVALVAAPVVGFLFGAQFMPLVPVLRVLLVGVVALSIGTVIANFFMLNVGRAAVPFSTALFSAFVCAGVSLVLVPRIGMMGAAIGTTASYVLSQVISIACFCKETGIRPARVLVVDAADLALYRRILFRTGQSHAA